MPPSSATERKSKLKIHPEPFKPSYLSIPPSPFSPRTPLPQTLPTRWKSHNNSYPTSQSNSTSKSKFAKSKPISEAPPAPLQWIWQCHQCHRSYGLGVTRRCLEDGHEFCAGTTTVKNWRKSVNPRRVKRGRACGSEFDYLGWKNWGRWRRSVISEGGDVEMSEDEENDSDEGESESSTSDSSSGCSATQSTVPSSLGTLEEEKKEMTPKKDCWNLCDYPSQCRWGKQFGIHTPVAAEFPTLPITTPPVVQTTPVNENREGILKAENIKETTTAKTSLGKKVERHDDGFWGALLASATKRKSVTPSSPLAVVAEEDPGQVTSGQSKSETDGGNANLKRDRDGDGDVVMGGGAPESFIDPQVLLSSSSSSSSSSTGKAGSVPISLKDMLKKTKRGRSARSKSEEPPRRPDTPLLLQTPPSFGLDFGFSNQSQGNLSHGNLNMDFAPLQRVSSREAMYHAF